eukprot:TRINITY_DN1464_c2_g1_i1.p1 TRINITY_DN1464_c2_g1~~TRINITY_DN1464_c2_g1_i1.p1  ORF type:complete len:271 (+),score=39.84 TRINITY_DN1464_c2_g1_i1:147-959(+)
MNKNIIKILLCMLIVSTNATYTDMREYSADECISRIAKGAADLSFCSRYNDLSCCLEGVDEVIHERFASMMSLGMSCSFAKTLVMETYEHLKSWFCLACDPNEPNYRFRTSVGDERNGIKPDLTSPHVWTWRVCLSFVKKVWSSEDLPGGVKYNTCGLKLPNPCSDQKQVLTSNLTSTVPVLHGWFPYQCGDNNVIPSRYFHGTWIQAASALLEAAPPPNLPDFRFVIVDDSINTNFRWEDTPCFEAGSQPAVPLTLTVALVVGFVLLVL